MTAGSLIVFMLPSFIATLLLLVLCRIYNRIGEWPAQHAYVPACHAGMQNSLHCQQCLLSGSDQALIAARVL